jgi:hypothetical protein
MGGMIQIAVFHDVTFDVLNNIYYMYVLGISVVLVEAKLPGVVGGGGGQKIHYIEGNPDIEGDVKFSLNLATPLPHPQM